ncbi:GAF domain-containing protein [Nostoc sp. LEGE 06077]|uniref:methyl-accepting chemotaxis protein n=1 Tax=Nostoc sp. LEGE 06077 TaxID=915325 RepID=UPI0018823CB3|nr:GAF domain-containing protein [Nostoc sp. LEGE 06077]MBE9209015.1 GAF domain-containing protein [Nostoc sp. LEGE 06077]
MTQPSTKKINHNIATTEVENPTASNYHNQADRYSTNYNNSSRRPQSLLPWSLKSKVTGWAIALTILPVFGIGAASYFGSQSITQQINQAKSTSAADWQKAEITLKQYQTSLLWGTGIIAVLSGAIASIISQYLTRPVVSAAEISTVLVNRLSRREEIETQTDLEETDELVALNANINQLQLHLPALLSKQETDTERSQLLINLTRRMQEALSEEDLLRTTVEEVRKALRIDRVVIFQFDSHWNGSFLEESAAPGLPKILWATVSDPCFQERYIEQYRQGRVRAINDIYQANLTDCHIGLLERFSIKANLVAPILKNNQLFGLLIGHQCSAPRFWQQAEIDLFAQVGTQLGFALDHTRLVEQIDKRADQAHLVINITRRIRESLNEEDVLKTTVEEIRKAISTDRVMVYGFDADWYGTVIAEAVVPGFAKALRARIKDPCFAEGYVDQYRAGRVQATNDIYKAGLSACHISQLEPFAVKANLVAPILKDDQLFGLLIAHQCTAPRDWQQIEIDLVAQLAMQVGFALDHARLLQRIDAEGVRTQQLVDITRKIRESLNEEDVLKTTVEEIRKAISTDRVMVYGFDADWYGTVIAEAVVPGFAKALRAKIKDPCFAEGYVDKYRAGRVQATNDIYKAGLSACHISQLEPFAVKANLVAPILKDDQLFGLLIAHQCTAPRDWQQPEIDLFAQLAMQVGFALDHARLLNQVEQAYQSVESALEQQNLRKAALQSQVSKLLKDHQTMLEVLSSQATSQMDSVSDTYNQIQALANANQAIFRRVPELENQAQQISAQVESGQEGMNGILDGISAVSNTVVEAATKLKHFEQPSQTLLSKVSLIAQVASQMKRQAMKVVFEAVRTGEAGQEFVTTAEEVLSLAQQLDDDMTKVKSLVGELYLAQTEIMVLMQGGEQQAIATTQEVEATQQALDRITAMSHHVNVLLGELMQAATNQVEISTTASQSILDVASTAQQTTANTVNLAKNLTKLTAIAQDWTETNI